MSTAPIVQWLADEICGKKQPGRVLKVGIDGRCAAGKSMLADALAPLVRAHGFEVLRPSVDGFHHPKAYRYRQGEDSAVGYYEDAFDYRAIVDVSSRSTPRSMSRTTPCSSSTACFCSDRN